MDNDLRISFIVTLRYEFCNLETFSAITLKISLHYTNYIYNIMDT